VDVNGSRILLVHDIGDVSDRSVTGHAVVIHGYTHKCRRDVTGDTLLLNPGEACGWLYGTPGAALLDLDTKDVTFITLEGEQWRW